MHVVWVRDRKTGDLLSPDDVVHVQRIQADEGKIECPHLKHLEDVIKPQEEEVRGACVDIHLATARHMNRIKWVSWIIRGEEASLCRKHMVMESPEIPCYGS